MFRFCFTKSILILGVFLLSKQATSQSRVDSFISVIAKTINKDSFNSWAYALPTVSTFNKFEKSILIDACINRTKDLGFELENAQFIFRKSIEKTINGKYKEALGMIELVIPIFEKEDPLYLSGALNTSGNMLSELGEKKKAIANLRRAIAITKKIDISAKRRLRATINHSLVLGNIFLRFYDLDSARNYFEKAYELTENLENPICTERAYALMNMAGVELRLKNFDKCIALNRQALAMAKNKFVFIECHALGKIGTAYQEAGNYDSSLYYLNKADIKAKENKINRLRLSNIDRTKSLFEKKKQFQSAFLKAEEYIQLKKEIDSIDESARADFLVSNAQRLEKKEAEFRIDKEKVKQRNLQIWLLITIGIALVLSLITYFWYQRRKLKEQLEKDRVEKEMIKSQIRAINSQMNPHFVFNSLNSIQELIVLNDIRNSNIYLGKFADLMRRTLEYSQEDEIYLQQELEALKLYLDLEQKRFGEELQIEINNQLDEYELKEIKVPSMLFQPYVENALKHGLLHKPGRKKLKVSISKPNGALQVIIEDNGIGRKKSAELNKRNRKNHKSYALNANQNRLDLIQYSSGRKIDVAFIDIENEGGTKVIFSFENKNEPQ